jgi:hypothetical protein
MTPARSFKPAPTGRLPEGEETSYSPEPRGPQVSSEELWFNKLLPSVFGGRLPNGEESSQGNLTL